MAIGNPGDTGQPPGGRPPGGIMSLASSVRKRFSGAAPDAPAYGEGAESGEAESKAESNATLPPALTSEQQHESIPLTPTNVVTPAEAVSAPNGHSSTLCAKLF